MTILKKKGPGMHKRKIAGYAVNQSFPHRLNVALLRLFICNSRDPQMSPTENLIVTVLRVRKKSIEQQAWCIE